MALGRSFVSSPSCPVRRRWVRTSRNIVLQPFALPPPDGAARSAVARNKNALRVPWAALGPLGHNTLPAPAVHKSASPAKGSVKHTPTHPMVLPYSAANHVVSALSPACGRRAHCGRKAVREGPMPAAHHHAKAETHSSPAPARRPPRPARPPWPCAAPQSDRGPPSSCCGCGPSAAWYTVAPPAAAVFPAPCPCLSLIHI